MVQFGVIFDVCAVFTSPDERNVLVLGAAMLEVLLLTGDVNSRAKKKFQHQFV